MREFNLHNIKPEPTHGNSLFSEFSLVLCKILQYIQFVYMKFHNPRRQRQEWEIRKIALIKFPLQFILKTSFLEKCLKIKNLSF